MPDWHSINPYLHYSRNGHVSLDKLQNLHSANAKRNLNNLNFRQVSPANYFPTNPNLDYYQPNGSLTNHKGFIEFNPQSLYYTNGGKEDGYISLLAYEKVLKWLKESNNKDIPGLTDSEQALLSFYNGTGNPALDKRSNLHNKYTEITKRSTRVGAESSLKRSTNKLERLKKIRPLINDDRIDFFEKEFDTLCNNIKAEFPNFKQIE